MWVMQIFLLGNALIVVIAFNPFYLILILTREACLCISQLKQWHLNIGKIKVNFYHVYKLQTKIQFSAELLKYCDEGS